MKVKIALIIIGLAITAVAILVAAVAARRGEWGPCAMAGVSALTVALVTCIVWGEDA